MDLTIDVLPAKASSLREQITKIETLLESYRSLVSYQPNTPQQISLGFFLKSIGLDFATADLLLGTWNLKTHYYYQDSFALLPVRGWFEGICIGRLPGKSPLATDRPGCSPWTTPLFLLEVPEV
jgi:hypothetical protein